MTEEIIDPFNPQTVVIRPAMERDLEGILKLQAENQLNAGGRLSASYSNALLLEMIQTLSVIVADLEGQIVGFLMVSPSEKSCGQIIIQAMLQAHPVDSETYVYGPICVSHSMRGLGIAGQLFAALGQLRPGLKCICFIRCDNQPSIKAHLKMGMTEVSRFTQAGVEYSILTSVAGQGVSEPSRI